MQLCANFNYRLKNADSNGINDESYSNLELTSTFLSESDNPNLTSPGENQLVDVNTRISDNFLNFYVSITGIRASDVKINLSENKSSKNLL